MEKLPEGALRTALARGRRDDVVAVMATMSQAERRRVTAAVRAHRRLVLASPGAACAPHGEWVGGLRAGHDSAAAAAYLAVAPLSQALRYAWSELADARDLPVALFPDHLETFAQEWSARFLRNPKAWDRIGCLEAMFDWVHGGLLDPPTHDGAVLLLVANGGRGPDDRGLVGYLEARPVLIDTTMARIFDVDGIKGASLAQADETRSTPRRRLDSHVIPELVRRGHWHLRFVHDGIARALARDPAPYHRRWWEGLAERLPR